MRKKKMEGNRSICKWGHKKKIKGFEGIDGGEGVQGEDANWR